EKTAGDAIARGERLSTPRGGGCDGHHLGRLGHDADGGAMDIALKARTDDPDFDSVHLGEPGAERIGLGQARSGRPGQSYGAREDRQPKGARALRTLPHAMILPWFAP